GVAQVITGGGAFVAGRLLDRFGGAGPFLPQAVLGGGLLLVATWADDVLVFGALYALGAGIVGATGFYHVTTVAAARSGGGVGPERAIAILTMIGAFASPIFLPLTAWMVETWDWRVAARALAVAAIAGGLAGSWLARGGASPGSGPSVDPIAAVRAALGDGGVRRMLAVYTLAGMSFGAVLVYQVPVMVAAGLTLGAAGAIGGLRGFCQIFGRVGLTGAIGRWGARPLLLAAYTTSAAGVALLLVDHVAAAVAFAVLAGAGLGATAPLQVIHARAYFDEGDLGLLMGMQGAVIGLAGGVGPFIGGLLRDATDSWNPVILYGALALSAAALLLWASPQPAKAAAVDGQDLGGGGDGDRSVGDRQDRGA
ncbi:MAG: MFS transporter, partial [Actinomycetota bacterium]